MKTKSKTKVRDTGREEVLRGLRVLHTVPSLPRAPREVSECGSCGEHANRLDRNGLGRCCR